FSEINFQVDLYKNTVNSNALNDLTGFYSQLLQSLGLYNDYFIHDLNIFKNQVNEQLNMLGGGGGQRGEEAQGSESQGRRRGQGSRGRGSHRFRG
ncbi:hypothetical protein Mgra_00003471, partial [Meloidogyne graminicola]